MLVQVVGKRNFHSEKKDKTYFILNTLYQDPQVEGWAVKERFVDQAIYNKASCGRKYDLVFSEGFSGFAVVSDLVPVNENNEG